MCCFRKILAKARKVTKSSKFETILQFMATSIIAPLNIIIGAPLQPNVLATIHIDDTFTQNNM
jgi:hypothetical protein